MKKLFNKKYLHYYLIGIIFITAIFLRLYNINEIDVWRDEAFTAILVQKSLKELIPILINDTSSFLHQFSLHFWVQLFGASELSIRIPSVTCSLFSIYYLYLIIRPNFKKYQQLLILSLFSVNIISIIYAQEARVYSMFTFLLIGTIFHLKNLLNKFTIKSAILWVIFNTCAFYSHNLSVFFIFTECFYILITYFFNSDTKNLIKIYKKNKKSLHQWLKLFIIFFITSIPWIVIMISQLSKFETGFWLTFDPIDTPQETLTGLATGIRLISQRQFGLLDSFLNTFTILLTLLGTLYELVNFKKLKIHFSIFFWIPYILMYLASFHSPVLYARYISFLAPYMIVLSFYGIVFLFKNKYIQIPIVSILIALNLRIYFVDFINLINYRAGYTNLVNYIDSNLSETDNILHKNALTFFPVKYYAHNKFESTIYDPNYETQFYLGRSMILEDDYTRDTSEMIKHERIWTIELNSNINIDEIESNFTLLEEKCFNGGLYLQLWEKN